MRLLKIILCLFLLVTRIAYAKPAEIIMWHSLADNLGRELQKLVTEFNQQQNNYLVKLIYKGEYKESLTSFVSAFRAKHPPAIIQIFEVGSSIMLQTNEVTTPLNHLTNESNLVEDFLPALKNGYSKNNQFQALPFNVSIPIMFYNKTALANVGYANKPFPQTWQELEILLQKLQQAGFKCGYTSSYPSWIHIEAFAALHGVSLLNKNHDQAIYNKEIANHLALLQKWLDKRYFAYGGRASDATILFTSGRCPIFSHSSGSYISLTKLVKFPIGIAPLPINHEVSNKRHANVIGGAALWVIQGHSSKVYQGIEKFFQYLSQPKVQQQWYEHTGYIPLGVSGKYACLLQGDKHSLLNLAAEELTTKDNQTINFTLAPLNQIRIINDEALENIFAHIQTASEALAEAINRTNALLLREKRHHIN